LTRVPRYFFHVHDSVDLLDNEGTELTGPDEARVQAVVTAGELLRDVGGRFWNSPEWRLWVIELTLHRMPAARHTAATSKSSEEPAVRRAPDSACRRSKGCPLR
jgi:hypothetical protein